jgi:hypothetical protein
LYVLQRIKDELEFIVYFVQDKSSETADRKIEISSKLAKKLLNYESSYIRKT